MKSATNYSTSFIYSIYHSLVVTYLFLKLKIFYDVTKFRLSSYCDSDLIFIFIPISSWFNSGVLTFAYNSPVNFPSIFSNDLIGRSC